MLFENHKCELDMGTDNFVNFGGCSKAKKAKSSNEDTYAPCWDHLPSVVLHDIFDLLSKEDRKNASIVCRNWRHNVFHPKWWPKMVFKIEQHEMEKAQFYTNTFGQIVSDATIRINSLSPTCVMEFTVLLRTLRENHNLKSLIIEPSHCRFEMPIKRIEDSEENDLADIMRSLQFCIPKLAKFSIGGVEDLSHYLNDILKLLNPKKVTHLGLASVKDIPGTRYQRIYLNPEIISPFEKLKILSIDYDHLSDKFLQHLEPVTQLERLVVHLHDVNKNHPSTSNNQWVRFCEMHPRCELRLNVIHAFRAIQNLQETVLKSNMPLTHLKVFFCERVNMQVLETLSAFYPDTLRSVMWVDSLSDSKESWVLASQEETNEHSPDPLVLMAWLCKKLEEIVLYGYKYAELNLMAIGRLRGSQMKNLEIAENEIIPLDDFNKHFLEDVRSNLGNNWAPVKRRELHPVITSPMAGDSDEYLLPIVLADLH